MVDIDQNKFIDHYYQNEPYYALLLALSNYNPKITTGDRAYLNKRQALFRERQKIKKVIDTQP